MFIAKKQSNISRLALANKKEHLKAILRRKYFQKILRWPLPLSAAWSKPPKGRWQPSTEDFSYIAFTVLYLPKLTNVISKLQNISVQSINCICPNYQCIYPNNQIYLSKLQIVFVQITSQRGTTIPLHGISLLFPSYFSFTNCNYHILFLQNLFWTCFPNGGSRFSSN